MRPRALSHECERVEFDGAICSRSGDQPIYFARGCGVKVNGIVTRTSTALPFANGGS